MEVEEKLEALAENTNTAARLEKHMTEMKSQKYEELQEQYEEDEISEEELERRMGELFESGDDFLDEEPDDGPTIGERMGGSLKSVGSTLDKYALPIFATLPFLFVLLMPGINPMIITVASPALFAIGITMYATYYAYRNF